MRAAIAVPAVLLLLSCQIPITRMAPPGEIPLRVNVWIQEDRLGREDAEVLLSEALRDRLADRARILPRGAEARDPEAKLEVHISGIRARGDLVKENAKDAFVVPAAAMAVGGMKTMDPYGFVFLTALGVVVGTVAAPVAAVGTEARGLYHNARLGYKPRHFDCQVTYRNGSSEAAKVLFRLGAWEVVKAMKPLAEGESRTTEAFQKEEAKALARVVCDKLAGECHWAPLGRLPSSDPAP